MIFLYYGRKIRGDGSNEALNKQDDLAKARSVRSALFYRPHQSE